MINKPFHRNYRVIKPDSNSGYSDWAYIVDHEYAQMPEHYTRAFLMIQEDLQRLFEYVEPCDQNMNTHSFRIYELFVRTCIEIEANFKAILRENIYSRSENAWNIKDYQLINATHHLDDYFVTVPIWSGENKIFQPFREWKVPNTPLSWYQDYNKCKHDRQQNFQKATFGNLLSAVTGLLVLLSSQFKDNSFSPGGMSLGVKTDSYYEGDFGLGEFFIVEYPKNWSEEEMYDFNWSNLKKDSNRFQKIDYDEISEIFSN
jgi:hypothetical protein